MYNIRVISIIILLICFVILLEILKLGVMKNEKKIPANES